jgi:hypothetical protein
MKTNVSKTEKYQNPYPFLVIENWAVCHPGFMPVLKTQDLVLVKANEI